MLELIITLLAVASQPLNRPEDADLVCEVTRASSLELVFFKTVAHNNGELPLFRARATLDGSAKSLVTIPLSHISNDNSELWSALVIPNVDVETKLNLALTDATGRTVEDISLVVEPVADPKKQAARLFQEADGTTLVCLALERTELRLSPISRAKLLALASSFESTSYGTMASFVLAASDFDLLQNEFGNDGPPRCYRACFDPLAQAIERFDRSPIFLEAARRLMIGKAWSSDYEGAKQAANAIIASNLSVKATAEAEKALSEIELLKEERDAIVKE
jgi:hypothetical protein